MPKLPMKAISILSISSLVFFISLPTNAMHPIDHGFQGAKPNCTYSIEIETTCAQSAETTDHVSVRFSDSKGNLIIVKHLNNPKLLYAPKGGSKRGGYGGFGRCAIDVFEASGPCMSSRVCSLYLKKVGSDDWRPGWVKVLHRQDGGHEVPVSYVFYFRTLFQKTFGMALIIVTPRVVLYLMLSVLTTSLKVVYHSVFLSLTEIRNIFTQLIRETLDCKV